jgi:hypothetical protein
MSIIVFSVMLLPANTYECSTDIADEVAKLAVKI